MRARVFVAADAVAAWVSGQESGALVAELLQQVDAGRGELWMSSLAPMLALQNLGDARLGKPAVERLARLLSVGVVVPVSPLRTASVLREGTWEAACSAEYDAMRWTPGLMVISSTNVAWQARGATLWQSGGNERSAAEMPLVDLTAQLPAIAGDVQDAIWRTLTSSTFIRGGDVRAFEEEFAAYCGAAHAVSVNSGPALHLISLVAPVQ